MKNSLIILSLALGFFGCSSDDEDAFSKGRDKTKQEPEVLESTENTNPKNSGNPEQEKLKPKATRSSCFEFSKDDSKKIAAYLESDKEGKCPSNIVIPENITTIGEQAFAYKDILSVIIPDSVTTIEDFAFSSGGKLAHAMLGNAVTTIGAWAFSGNKLTSVIIPDSVTSIGERAFSYNKIRSLDIGAGVTSIGNSAFSYNHLISVKIPSGVQTIDKVAFDKNSQLLYVCVEAAKSSVTLGSNAFPYFSHVSYEADASCGQATRSSCFQLSEGGSKITAYLGSDNQGACPVDVVIPNNVTTIGDSAFAYNEKIETVVIPDSVKTIEYAAFMSGERFAYLAIGSGVTTIGAWAFSGNKLTSIIIPDSVTAIGERAFSYNKIWSLELGTGVTSIGNSSFSYNELTSVKIPSGVQTIDQVAFDKNKDLASACIEADKANITVDRTSFAYYTNVSYKADCSASE